MKLDFDTVIPGHGPVTNKAGLQTYRDNVEKMRDRVTQGRSAAARARTRSPSSWRPSTSGLRAA